MQWGAAFFLNVIRNNYNSMIGRKWAYVELKMSPAQYRFGRVNVRISFARGRTSKSGVWL